MGTQRSEFSDDGQQHRVRIVEKDNGVVQSDTKVVWCDDRICEERASNGLTVTRRAFARGEQIGNVIRFFSSGHLGSVGEVTDSWNALFARFAYDPWGRRTVMGGTDVTTAGFTGHERAPTSELWLAMYRAYDSDLARWVIEDPAGWEDGPNLYGDVVGNPVNLIDPLGLNPESCVEDDLLSPAVALRVRPCVNITTLVTLGAYLLYSDLCLSRSSWHRREMTRPKSVALALALLIVLAAVVYFVLPYAFD